MGGKRVPVIFMDPHETHGDFLMNALLTQMYLCVSFFWSTLVFLFSEVR
jgi:hypothetical protein